MAHRHGPKITPGPPGKAQIPIAESPANNHLGSPRGFLPGGFSNACPLASSQPEPRARKGRHRTTLNHCCRSRIWKADAQERSSSGARSRLAGIASIWSAMLGLDPMNRDSACVKWKLEGHGFLDNFADKCQCRCAFLFGRMATAKLVRYPISNSSSGVESPIARC